MTETAQNLADLTAILAAARAGATLPADRVAALALRYLASAPEGRGRIDPDAYRAELLSEFGGRFLHQGRDLDETQAGRMLAAALRRAAVDIEDRTHFIPCRPWPDGSMASLAVGPVNFRRTEAFRRSQTEALTADPEFVATVERDFAPWPFVAEVTVRGCDRVISRQRALEAVDRALDLLRLFAGADSARALGRAGAPGPPILRPAGLWADSKGRLHPVRAEAVGAGDPAEIAGRLRDRAGRAWLDGAGRSLQPLVDPALNWPLAARFREAVSWYGAALAETSAAARIVDFVAAIERAVVAADHADIWRLVTQRASLLAAGAAREDQAGAAGDDAAEWLARARAVYDCRSRIVHGGLSPFAPEATSMAPDAERLARAVLRGVLPVYARIGLARAAVSADRLERAFDRLGDGARG